MWQFGQLAEMVAPYKNGPTLETVSSLDKAAATARFTLWAVCRRDLFRR